MLLFLFRCALLIIVSFPFVTLADPTPFDKQEFMEELETLINYGEFEKANNNIQDKLNLTSIANDYYFKYELYLKKSLIYKSVFNYTSALDNLNYAEQHGIKDLSKKPKVISTIKVERLFIYFDLQLEEQFRILFSKITSQDIAHLSPKTKSFYNSILGILAMRENKFNEAEKIYDQAIQQLKKEDPKHLPNIYRAKVALYSALNNEAKALEAFNTGLKYAEQYQVQLYKIVMHEALTKYYVDKNDYKKALKYQTKVSELRTAYNANNVSGKLNLLDKEYEQFHKEIELEKAKKKNYFFMFLSTVLLLFIFLLSKLLIANKQKRKLIERENIAIRNLIQNIPSYKEKDTALIHLEEYPLSTRQLEIVELVKKGKTNKEIGEILFISENTVKYHLKSIYDILGVGSRIELKHKIPQNQQPAIETLVS